MANNEEFAPFTIDFSRFSNVKTATIVVEWMKKFIQLAAQQNFEMSFRKLINILPADRKAQILNTKYTYKENPYKEIPTCCLLSAVIALDEKVYNIYGDYNGKTENTVLNPDLARTAVRILLENGANPNILDTDKNYVSILCIACEYGDLQIVRSLLDAGANVNYMNADTSINESSGATAMSSLFQYTHDFNAIHTKKVVNDKKQIVDLLYERGYNLCKANKQKHLITFAIRSLANYFYNIDEKENDTKKALLYALPLFFAKCFDTFNDKVSYDSESYHPDKNRRDEALIKKLITKYKNLANSLQPIDLIATPNEVIVDINDNVPTELDDIIEAETDVNEATCKERGFIVTIKTPEGYVYECISKKNLVFYNSGAKGRGLADGVINLYFKNQIYKVEMPNWLKQQNFARWRRDDSVLKMADKIIIPEPKIFILQDSPTDRSMKILQKARFVDQEPVAVAVAQPTRKRRRNDVRGGRKHTLRKNKNRR